MQLQGDGNIFLANSPSATLETSLPGKCQNSGNKLFIQKGLVNLEQWLLSTVHVYILIFEHNIR